MDGLLDWLKTPGARPPRRPWRPPPGGDESDERRIPHSIEAEQMLLGSVLADNGCMNTAISAGLSADDFHDPVHARLFGLFAGRIGRGQRADPTTLAPILRGDRQLDELGGLAYLVSLMRGAIGIENVAHYAETIIETARRRRLMALAWDLAGRAESPDGEIDAASLVADTERRLAETLPVDTGRGFKSLLGAATEALVSINDAFKAEGALRGLPTGLPALDRALGGLAPSDLVIVAGRPAMGKTALAANIAFSLASSGRRVAFFSLEMSAKQLAARLISAAAEVSGSEALRGELSTAEMRLLVEAVRDLEDAPLFISDSSMTSTADVAAQTRRLRSSAGLDAVFVDYLQLMSAGRESRNRVEEVGEITRSLKALARELEVPVVALSQLSRNVEQRENKRPNLADLRESGSIEQDADVVMFVFREEYYLLRSEPDQEDEAKWGDWNHRMERARGLAEIIVGKHRHGETGTARLRFDGATTQFTDPAKGVDDGGEAW